MWLPSAFLCGHRTAPPGGGRLAGTLAALGQGYKGSGGPHVQTWDSSPSSFLQEIVSPENQKPSEQFSMGSNVDFLKKCFDKTTRFSYNSLLRNDLHTIQFAHLKCIAQWFSVHSQMWTNIALVNLRTFVLSQKEHPHVSLSSPNPHVPTL